MRRSNRAAAFPIPGQVLSHHITLLLVFESVIKISFSLPESIILYLVKKTLYK
ncbi:hypothetical protein YPPY08_4558 [Yersinia pestis PY-08]|uniref:Uncharacterized protein n=1 Tax=Yersinia pestis PY-08 TaxID=992134 RepID=A0AB72ZF20_YERPE|nr:hypothetical protein YPPY04_4496 [Yersinia pestis PY-04]EIR12377.1 hypothetical protein YPPY08_4558 [Yersinia pestis PY-08]